MPEDDDGLVPPLKVMRKRLNGVYSAEGFRAPTRRYVLMVALLVALASVPTLAAITAGSNSLEDGTVGALEVPLLPPVSAGPVLPPGGSPSALPSASSGSGSAPSSPSVGEEASVQGLAGNSSAKPKPSKADRGAGEQKPTHFRPGHSQSRSGGRPGGSVTAPGVPSRPGKPASPGDSSPGNSPGAGSEGSGSDGSGSDGSGSDGSGSDGSGSDGSGSDGSGSDGSGSEGWDSDWSGSEAWWSDEWGSGRSGSSDSGADGSGVDGSGSAGSNASTQPADPDDPGQQPPPTRQPWCNDRGDCSPRPSHHHRPDWSRHRHCGESTHKARYSHHREGRTRTVIVHIGSAGRHAQPITIREAAHDQPRSDRTKQLISHRSDSTDRSSSRRSEVVERPQNLRLARSPERAHNSHRSQYAADHADGPPAASHSYRGSHRAERVHSTDDQRSSRVGRHHADPHRDHSGHW